MSRLGLSPLNVFKSWKIESLPPTDHVMFLEKKGLRASLLYMSLLLAGFAALLGISLSTRILTPVSTPENPSYADYKAIALAAAAYSSGGKLEGDYPHPGDGAVVVCPCEEVRAEASRFITVNASLVGVCRMADEQVVRCERIPSCAQSQVGIGFMRAIAQVCQLARRGLDDATAELRADTYVTPTLVQAGTLNSIVDRDASIARVRVVRSVESALRAIELFTASENVLSSYGIGALQPVTVSQTRQGKQATTVDQGEFQCSSRKISQTCLPPCEWAGGACTSSCESKTTVTDCSGSVDDVYPSLCLARANCVPKDSNAEAAVFAECARAVDLDVCAAKNFTCEREAARRVEVGCSRNDKCTPIVECNARPCSEVGGVEFLFGGIPRTVEVSTCLKMKTEFECEGTSQLACIAVPSLCEWNAATSECLPVTDFDSLGGGERALVGSSVQTRGVTTFDRAPHGIIEQLRAPSCSCATDSSCSVRVPVSTIIGGSNRVEGDLSLHCTALQTVLAFSGENLTSTDLFAELFKLPPFQEPVFGYETLGEAANQGMLQSFEVSAEHEAYYNVCKPTQCTYTVRLPPNTIDAIVEGFALIGGLSVVIAKFVQIICMPWQYQGDGKERSWALSGGPDDL